jgi:hypothetical protein
MDPQQAAHLIRLMRTIATELRLANDIAASGLAYPNSTSEMANTVRALRAQYEEEGL